MKVKVKHKEIDLFVYSKCFCDQCYMWMVRLRLKGILVCFMLMTEVLDTCQVLFAYCAASQIYVCLIFLFVVFFVYLSRVMRVRYRIIPNDGALKVLH